jgi:ribosomal protein RSM22 (predicted rRNA methylase)
MKLNKVSLIEKLIFMKNIYEKIKNDVSSKLQDRASSVTTDKLSHKCDSYIVYKI